MTLKPALITLAILLPGAALACPDYQQWGTELHYSGDDLWSERTHFVVAGGSSALAACFTGVEGYAMTRPDFTIDYTRTQNFELHIEARGNCDTVLLVNDAHGNWYYDDDDGPGTDSRVVLRNPGSGYIDVWIGTYGSDTCSAAMTLETF